MADLAVKKKSIVVPYKKTMNLVMPDNPVNWTKIIIIAAVLVVVALAATKFGILDPLSKKNAATLELSEKQAQYTSMSTKMAEYSEVEAKYGRYSYGWMNDQEQAMLEKEKVLEIIETKIASVCTVESLSVSNNTVSLSVSGITLDQGREMVKALKEDENVASATIYSAVSSEEAGHTATMTLTVIFQKEVIE